MSRPPRFGIYLRQVGCSFDELLEPAHPCECEQLGHDALARD